MTELPSHDFMPVREEDWPLICSYLQRCNYEESNHNVLDMLMWLDWYPLFYVGTEDYLLLMVVHEGQFFMYMPLCDEAHFAEAIHRGRSIFEHYGYPFRMCFYTRDIAEKVRELLPEVTMTSSRDDQDYVYETQKMITLSGKHLQKKRNHLNAFCREYEGRWSYETMTEENLPEVRAYFRTWVKPESEQDEKLRQERIGVERVLDMFGQVPYKGGLIRIDGQVKAFAIGTRESDRMCQENIEKADENIRGLYQVIMSQFLQHEMSEYQYVNREDDFGEENLRHAKESLHPAFMIEKFMITEEKK